MQSPYTTKELVQIRDRTLTSFVLLQQAVTFFVSLHSGYCFLRNAVASFTHFLAGMWRTFLSRCGQHWLLLVFQMCVCVWGFFWVLSTQTFYNSQTNNDHQRVSAPAQGGENNDHHSHAPSMADSCHHPYVVNH